VGTNCPDSALKKDSGFFQKFREICPDWYQGCHCYLPGVLIYGWAQVYERDQVDHNVVSRLENQEHLDSLTVVLDVNLSSFIYLAKFSGGKESINEITVHYKCNYDILK